MTYAMTNHLRKSSTCKSPHGMTHFQRYECASCAARTSCFNMTVDADEAYRIGIVENEDTNKTTDEIRAEEIAAEEEDYTPSAVCLHILAVELAHREALKEDANRNYCANLQLRY